MSILLCYKTSVLNTVLIHIALHRLECALHVELYSLNMAVLGIYCTYYLHTEKHLSGDHNTLAKDSMLQLLCVLVV